MNRYALDVTRIAGWRSWYAAGNDVAITLSSQAAGLKAILGAATAALTLSATGPGALATLANATALLALSATGIGTIGSQPVVAHPGYGDMEMTLVAYAAPTAASVMVGVGAALLRLTATHGIPKPPVIPGTFMAAHPRNEMDAPPRDSAMIVSHDTMPNGRMR